MNAKIKKLIRIKSVLLAFLILLCSIIMITLLSLQYYFSKQLAFNAINENFKHISERLDNKIKTLDNNNNSIISMLEFYNSINEKPKLDKRHSLFPIFTHLLEDNKYIYSFYIGYKNKDFYEVINLNINNKLKDKYKVTADVQWLIIKIIKNKGQRVRYEYFLDKNFKNILIRKKIATYDPTTRPWYKEALKTHNITKTKPYMFKTLESIGITYVKNIKKSNSVIAIDVSLESFNLFLKSQLKNKKEEILLFKEDGSITTYVSLNNNKKIDKTEYKYIIDFAFSDNKNIKHTILDINKTKYFVYISKIESTYFKKDYLAILIPIEEIMHPYNKKIIYSFFLTSLVALFLIPIILYSARLLIKPITLLEDENLKILNRDFSNVRKIDTRLKEINDLSYSLVSMSQSIQTFQDSQKELMDSFIQLIASAIDAKSKYTAGHCERVPLLTMMIAKAANEETSGIFKDFNLKNKEERRELSVAAWLHDCGKVTTPEYVVDKATKLETKYNRIHEIRTRFEVIYRDLTISYLKNIKKGKNKKKEKSILLKEQKKLLKEFEIIAKANIGSEFMTKKEIKKIKEISNKEWYRYFDNQLGISKEEKSRIKENKKSNKLPKKEYLLDDKHEHIIPREKLYLDENKNYKFKQKVPKYLYNLGEVYNLCITKGTLSFEERYKVNEHVKMSIIMLEQLPFPNNLKKVSEYAGAHHETLIGTGYPRQLKKEDMSIPARIIAIADIFEALTASDRPYKEAKTLSEALRILSFMVKDRHVDADIFKLFLKSGIIQEYANTYLKKEQIDEINIKDFIDEN